MAGRLAAVAVGITLTSVFLGWLVFNPTKLELKAAHPDRDTAVFGSILDQATGTATASPATPTAAPTPTPIPPTPTPTPTASTSSNKNNLPVIPIFLGILFVGLVIAVALPVIRSRFGRR